MPQETLQSRVIRAYGLHIMLREAIAAGDQDGFDTQCQKLYLDLLMLQVQQICATRYFNPRPPVPKFGSLHLAWEYTKDPLLHHRFWHMLRVSPFVLQVILDLVKDHPVFHNRSNNPQLPVDFQLAVTLYRMGRYGNGASLKDLAMVAGIAEGTVALCTHYCFDALEALHDMFVWPLTADEKEVEKQWIDGQIGFLNSLWREG